MSEIFSFNKLHNISGIQIHTLDDVRHLTDFLLKDTHFLLNDLLKRETDGNELIINDLIYLIEFNAQGSLLDNRDKCKSILDTIIYGCLTSNNNQTCYTLIKRLYIRGFAKDLALSIINYYTSSVCVDRRLQKEDIIISRIGAHKTTLYLCSSILRVLSPLVRVENTSDGLELCVNSNQSYNLIIHIIALLMNSFIHINNLWNIDALFDLFHPLSMSFLSGPISFLIIDYLPCEQQLELLQKLSCIWSDFQLLAQLSSNEEVVITTWICRLLTNTKKCAMNNRETGHITKYITLGINKRLGNTNKIERNCGIAVAESLFSFLNGAESTYSERDDLKFDGICGHNSTDMQFISSAKLDIVVRPDCCDINDPIASPNTLPYAEPVSRASESYRETDNSNVDGYMDVEKRIDLIFEHVPRINSETIENCINEVWITPPQHIVQCYERLLSKPVRGDIDFGSMLSHDLSKVDDDTLKNKILSIGQTLLYLPHVVEKDETILRKFAIPISESLIKLDNLQIYKDAIDKISDKVPSKHKRLVSEENSLKHFDSKSTEISPNFISYDPEHLVFAGLTSIVCKYPLKMIEYFSSQLFNSEFSLPQRATMVLSMQYSSIGLSRSMKIGDICNKFISDRDKNKIITDASNSPVDKLRIPKASPISVEDSLHAGDPVDIHSREVINPMTGVSGSDITKSNINKFNAVASNAVSCLIQGVQGYMRENIKGRCNTHIGSNDEIILIGVIETLIIFLGNSHKSITNEVLERCSDMVFYCLRISEDRTMLKLLEVLGAAILEYNNE